MKTKHLGALFAVSIAAPQSAAQAAAYTFTTITVPSAVPLGSSQVNDINDAGQFVGSFYTATRSAFRAFIGDLASGTVTTFYDPNRFQTDGNGINNLGQVVGTMQMSGGGFGYVRDPSTGAYSFFPGPSSTIFTYGYSAYGINDAGDIVGNFSTDRHGSDFQSFLYDPATGSTSGISDPATHTSFSTGTTAAFDINNRGQVVGDITTVTPSNSISTGFLLDLATNTYTVISVPGSTSTGAHGINDKGQVVGGYSTASGTAGYVFDLSTNQYTTLSDPGATSTSALGINNLGQIVGSFVDATGTQQGFVATPSSLSTAVPEPASLALLGGSVCVLVGARRRAPLRGVFLFNHLRCHFTCFARGFLGSSAQVTAAPREPGF